MPVEDGSTRNRKSVHRENREQGEFGLETRGELLEYFGLVFRDNDGLEEDPKRKLISAGRLPRNKTYVLSPPRIN